MDLKTIKDYLYGCLVSLTIWFNGTGMVILSIALTEPVLLTWLTAHGFVYLIFLGNILLRFKTQESLKDKE